MHFKWAEGRHKVLVSPVVWRMICGNGLSSDIIVKSNRVQVKHSLFVIPTISKIQWDEFSFSRPENVPKGEGKSQGTKSEETKEQPEGWTWIHKVTSYSELYNSTRKIMCLLVLHQNPCRTVRFTHRLLFEDLVCWARFFYLPPRISMQTVKVVCTQHVTYNEVRKKSATDLVKYNWGGKLAFKEINPMAQRAATEAVTKSPERRCRWQRRHAVWQQTACCWKCLPADLFYAMVPCTWHRTYLHITLTQTPTPYLMFLQGCLGIEDFPGFLVSGNSFSSWVCSLCMWRGTQSKQADTSSEHQRAMAPFGKKDFIAELKTNCRKFQRLTELLQKYSYHSTL